ncbi:MAG: sensor histidine kinase [Merdibacter sp.]
MRRAVWTWPFLMILQPLVENAVKHGLKNVTRDGEVEIYLGADAQRLTISVSDNGEGMPKEEAEALLQRCSGGRVRAQLGLFNMSCSG